MSREGDHGNNRAKLLLQTLDRVALESVEPFHSERGLILFSGGVDSSILARLISRAAERVEDWGLYTLGLEGSPDIIRPNDFSSSSSSLPFSRRIVKQVDAKKVLDAARKVLDLVQCSNLSQLEDCTSFYLICQCIEGGEAAGRVLLTANGPDELFCGYDRFRRIVDRGGYQQALAESKRALLNARELQERVRKIGANFGRRISEPFLGREFANFCIEEIPAESKIRIGNDMLRKRIWREYGRFLGLPEEVVLRPKKAMQYSMGVHKVIHSAIRRRELVFEMGRD